MSDFGGVFGGLELLSLMAYPSSKDLRDKFNANRVAKMVEEWPELNAEHIIQEKRPEGWSLKKWQSFVKKHTGELRNELDGIYSASGGIRSLYNSIGHDAYMQDYYENCYRGALAGNVLIYIRRMADSHLTNEASVSKAIFMVEEIIGRKMLRKQKNKNISISERFIRKAWSDFKLVSPLWAAYGYWIGWKKLPSCSPFFLEGIPRFFSLANNFREFGTTHVPRASKIPTLLPQETWLPPKKIKIIDFLLEPFPLSSKELKVLDNYQAPIRKKSPRT
jgi:hypothetical protein